MVSPGAVAGPSVSLRCQLREVLLQTRIRPRLRNERSHLQQRSNGFSVFHRRRQEFGDDFQLEKPRKPYFWKRVNTPERVIGKPGKRQRVVSQRLSRDSLDKPSNVIVFRDVKEEHVAQPLPLQTEVAQDDELRPKALTAKEIENAITGRYIAPAEAEVNASIEALRPPETVVEERQFDEHYNKLLKGYTFPQLSQYLVWSLQASATSAALREESTIGDEIHELGSTQWHSGQTPLFHRHANVAKKTGKNTKAKMVEQILRLSWHLTIQSEEQEIGELEVQLQPWQASMLFELTHNDRPYYESFIRSPILVKSTEVQLYEPDSILRVTGRRQDTEEVIRQLKLALLGTERLEVDMKVFAELQGKSEELFNDEEIRYVSDLTKAVIMDEGNGIVGIYGRSESARNNARRLLLALLELSASTSIDKILPAGGIARPEKSNTALVLVDASTGLHRRNRTKALCRTVKPEQRMTGASKTQAEYTPQSPPLDGETVEALVEELENMPIPERAEAAHQSHVDSYWKDELLLNDWKVEFCRILQESTSTHDAPKGSKRKVKEVAKESVLGGSPERAIIQHQVPGLQNVLSFFESVRTPKPLNANSTHDKVRFVDADRKAYFDPRMPYLIAHFVPSQSALGSHKKLPSLEMRFKFSSPQRTGPRELVLSALRAVVEEQHLIVPVPEYSVDIRFSRQLGPRLRRDQAKEDPSIRNFTAKLQESVNSGTGALDAPPEVEFRLPRWILADSVSQPQEQADVAVKYLFERFEQVQRVQFTPRQKLAKVMDEEVRLTAESTPKHMILDYREVEGGSIYGSRTLLGLRRVGAAAPANGSPGSDKEADGTSAAQQSQPREGEGQYSPLLDADTDKMTNKQLPEAVEGAEVQSQARTTHHGDEHGQAVPESMGDVQKVEQNAESSQDTTAKTTELVSTALRFAHLLTRATNGSLKHFGSKK